MIKQILIKKLKTALKKIGVSEKEIPLEWPANPRFGDYASSVALKLAAKLKKSPSEIAEKIAAQLPKNELIERIEVVKPGFINFFLSKKYLIKEVKKISEQKENYGKQAGKNFKILLEFGQPNTHKLPHLGHLYSYIYGESLARIFEFLGNKVYRVNYQGDIGLHVAKCLYILRKKPKERENIEKIKNKEEQLNKKVSLLQRCYQEGSGLYEKNSQVKKEIDFLNIQLYQKNPSLLKLWQETRQWSLDFYKSFEKNLDIKYDKYYFESETGPLGKKIVCQKLNSLFKKSQEAIVFQGEKFGLHTRVFINRYDNPTYEAKDIGLITKKIQDFNFDFSIVTTAREQNEYWKVIIKVSELLYPELKNKLKHIGFGMVHLTTGKMSSRTGQIIDALSLLKNQTNLVLEKYGSKESTKIAQAAIKYSFLNSIPTKDIVFNPKKSIAKEGNSGPYLLYTYVRTQSVLKKAKKYLNNNRSLNKLTGLKKEEVELLRLLSRFSEIIEEAGKKYSPSVVANYLFNLAQKYNLFYQKYPILKAKDDKKIFRLLLTKAVGQIIKNGLYLLGIKTVKKM